MLSLSHRQREHNLWEYMDLVEALATRDYRDFTGVETYISECVLAGNWSFIPFKKVNQTAMRTNAAPMGSVAPTRLHASIAAGSSGMIAS